MIYYLNSLKWKIGKIKTKIEVILAISKEIEDL